MNAGWSNSLIQQIARGLVFNNNTVSYKGSLNQGKSSTVSLVSLGNAEQFRYINTIMQRSAALISAIQNDPFLDSIAKKDYERKIINQVIKPLRNLSQFGEKSQAEQQLMSKKGKRYTGTIPLQLAEFYFTILSDIKTEITGIKDINIKLQAGLAEVLSNLMGKGAISAGIHALQKELSKPSVGLNKTSKSLNSNSALSLSVVKTLEKNKVALTQSGSYTDKTGAIKSLWTFSGIGDPVQQKADANFTFTASDGTKTTHGVSIKNTDLTTYINKNIKDDMQNFIPIQANTKTGGSSLMLYLLGMNQDYPGTGIANHYLNVFSEHSDLEKGALTNIHKKALESFKVAILYSALTGKGQLRQGGHADILAIYDKGKHGVFQVKLFDMYSIVQDASILGADQVAKYIPSDLNELQVKNEKEEDENLSTEENVNVRLTKVLLDIRKQHISVYLSKEYLNSALKNRGF